MRLLSNPFTGEMDKDEEVARLQRRIARLEERAALKAGQRTNDAWAKMEAQLWVAEEGLRAAAVKGSREAQDALDRVEVL